MQMGWVAQEGKEQQPVVASLDKSLLIHAGILIRSSYLPAL